ncbi:MAG: carboxypeptidase-like regulatory domain-containing protein [Bacteroidetes bacterium]|nr:carboxypeptidase-like regulatory domain-containing protein [Bacteroidota bacterium]
MLKMVAFRYFFTIIILVISVNRALGQQDEKNELVQFSGIVVTADSLTPVPFTNIIIKNTWRGTVADYYGYFSFVAQKGDSLMFSAVGFKKGEFLIPDSITGDRYSLIQVMASDTIMLTQTVIYPWPSKEQFKEAFLKYDVPDDDYERARKNLDLAQLKQAANDYPMDGSMNFRNSMQLYQDKLYYIGQTQPITILNPFAWAEFIKAWKEGKFKRKDKD